MAVLTYTPVASPTVSTSAATSVLATSATLRGLVSDGAQFAVAGTNSTYQFQYGTDPAFGSFTSTTLTSFSGAGVSVSASVSGLTASTRYYARVLASNSVGTTYGQVVSFETTTNVPTIVNPTDGTATAQADITFSWTYNSGGAAGGQTAYSLRLTGPVPGHAGNGPWWWSGSAWTATQTWVTSTAQSVTITAAFLTPSTNYTWSVATQDANGQSQYA